MAFNKKALGISAMVGKDTPSTPVKGKKVMDKKKKNKNPFANYKK